MTSSAALYQSKTKDFVSKAYRLGIEEYKEQYHGEDSQDRQEQIQDKLMKGIQSIRVLHCPNANESFLQQYQGKLYSIDPSIIEAIERVAPKSFHAKVADFNENLDYKMQQELGLGHLGLPSSLMRDIVNTDEFLISFLSTCETIPQPPHVDYTWEFLESHGNDLDIGFMPLTNEGMYLQVWPREDDVSQKVIGEIIYIPYGKMLTVSSRTIHGGGFRTTKKMNEPGNLRAHLYIAKNDTRLQMTQSNKYTEPNDKGKELCERYLNAEHMDTVVKYMFV